MSCELTEVEGIVVISTDGNPATHYIRNILGVDELPTSEIYNNIKGYPWEFETKYYSAKVNVYAIEDKVELEPSFSDLVKAMIFCFDSEKVSSFDELVSWLPFLQNIDSEVQLLVCNNCSNENVASVLQKKNILNWCVENQFELIELNPQEESDVEDSSIIPDAKGYARIIEALQSHTWANLVMKSNVKENTNPLPKDKNEDMEASSQVSCSGSSTSENTKKVCVENEELLLEEKLLSNVLSGDDPGGESFEALFEKFASMKEKASALTGEDRKKYAEKVAVAFWRAMGGDEEEIEGLDED